MLLLALWLFLRLLQHQSDPRAHGPTSPRSGPAADHLVRGCEVNATELYSQAGKAYLQAVDPKKDARLEASRALAEQAEDTQRQPRSLVSRLVYQAYPD